MDKNEMIKKFMNIQNHKKSAQCLDYLKEYIADLEQKNIDLQSIVADPEGEVARCRAEVRELQLKLNLQDAYSISSEERKAGHTWLIDHAEQCHDGECNRHWEISPHPLGVAVNIVCDECGEEYCVRME